MVAGRDRNTRGLLSGTPKKQHAAGAKGGPYDGSWTRHIGSDGGRTLHWHGNWASFSPALG